MQLCSLTGSSMGSFTCSNANQGDYDSISRIFVKLIAGTTWGIQIFSRVNYVFVPNNPRGVNIIMLEHGMMLLLKKHCECLLLQIRSIPSSELQMKILRPVRKSTSIHTATYCNGLCKYKIIVRHRTIILIQKQYGKNVTM